MLAQQNGFVPLIYWKQYTQFNTGNIWHTKAALHLKVHYRATDILNVSGVFASLEGKRRPDSHNSQWRFLSRLDFICRTHTHKKSSTIKIDLYSWHTYAVAQICGGKRAPKMLWCWVMSLYLNDHWRQTHKAKLWGDMLMKCQSCHFICSNYRLACRPFNDHLQHSLQCIRGSTKSLPLWHSLYLKTHACLHYREHTLPAHILLRSSPSCPPTSPSPTFLLVYLQSAKTRQLIELLSLGLSIRSRAEHL